MSHDDSHDEACVPQASAVRVPLHVVIGTSPCGHLFVAAARVDDSDLTDAELAEALRVAHDHVVDVTVARFSDTIGDAVEPDRPTPAAPATASRRSWWARLFGARR